MDFTFKTDYGDNIVSDLYKVECPKCGYLWGYDENGKLVRRMEIGNGPMLTFKRVCPKCGGE